MPFFCRRLNVIWNVFLGIEEAESRATSGLAGRSVDAAGKADAEPSVSLDFFIDSFVGGSRDELASQVVCDCVYMLLAGRGCARRMRGLCV